MNNQLELARMAIASLSRKDRLALLAELRPGAPVGAPSEHRILRRKQAAEKLCCSVRLIDKLAAQGLLPRVTLPGRVHGAGFRLSDIDRLIGAAS
jgi:predicted DNA-binding transcriptional regulator AlpA